MEGEITDHVGYDEHDSVVRNSGNGRNSNRAKTVLTDVGPVEVRCPATPPAPPGRRSSRSGSGA